MNKTELFQKISEVQDLITELYDCKTVADKCETIVMALSGLITVKVSIEGYYQYHEEGYSGN